MAKFKAVNVQLQKIGNLMDYKNSICQKENKRDFHKVAILGILLKKRSFNTNKLIWKSTKLYSPNYINEIKNGL